MFSKLSVKVLLSFAITTSSFFPVLAANDCPKNPNGSCVSAGVACTDTSTGVGECVEKDFTVGFTCQCPPNNPSPNGAANDTKTSWTPNAPITLPLPGGSVNASFTLDLGYSLQEATVRLGSNYGGSTLPLSPLAGTLSLTGTRRSTTGQENILDLCVTSSSITAASITIPNLGPTGTNHITYNWHAPINIDGLTGTLDLDTGRVEMNGTARIVNDIFHEAHPVIVVTSQTGVWNSSTGVLEIATTAIDSVPSNIPALTSYGVVLLSAGLMVAAYWLLVWRRRALARAS